MRLTVKEIRERKKAGRKIAVLTAYDYSFARILDDAGIDVLLVGDSLGMVCLGYESTLPVTLRDMLHHTKAVSRGTRHALVVADLPFGSMHSASAAVRAATRLIKEGGADAVKPEGGAEIAGTVKALRDAGVPVMGHIGLTPQSYSELGGYKVQGRGTKEESKLLADAAALEQAGAFAVVLECVPAELAKKITKKLSVPTVGIGAGPHCDGQVLVLYDLLALQDSVRPKFVRTYAPVGSLIRKAAEAYRHDVVSGKFPSAEESYQSESSKPRPKKIKV